MSSSRTSPETLGARRAADPDSVRASPEGDQGRPIADRTPPDDPTVIRQLPPLGIVGTPWTDADSQAAPLVGMRLGHFELREFVGGGGMGAVYRGLDTLLGREVAVKVLSPDLGRDPEVVRRFKNEAQSAARLDHDHITRVYFVGEDQGWHFIVFEFIDGVNLRDYVAQHGPLPLADALLYTVQIAQAIEHASGRDVVHRDIKPSNVLLAGPGRVKLVDMGLARVLLVDPSQNELTASGVTLGTFDYISPEQARDPRAADVRSDLYSLGCTFYFMLTGRPPFPRGTVLQKLLQHQGDDPPDPREARPDLPPELSGILRRLLAKSPGQRYQSPRELIGDLAALAARLQLPLAPASAMWIPAPAPRFDWTRQLNWALPVAALLGIVLVLDLLERRDQPTLPQTGAALPRQRLAAETKGATAPTASQSNPPPVVHDGGTQADAARAAGPRAAAVSSDSASDSQELSPARTAQGTPLGVATILRAAGGVLQRTVDAWFDSQPNAVRRPTTRNGAPAGPRAGPTESAAAGPGSLPPAPPALAATTAASDGLLVVTDEPSAPREYRSLRTACSVAKDGEIIELRFDGPRETEPIAVGMRRVTIRPGKGFRPVIAFRPNQADPIRYPRNMISVAGGRLTLLNVVLELDVPSLEAIPAASWSLLASQRAERIQLENCTLTIRNAQSGRSAQHPDVAFFDFRPPPGADSMLMGSTEPRALAEGRVELEDCVLRGEAACLRLADVQPLRFTWNNGLLATSERMVYLAPRPMSERPPGRLLVELRHLTAAVGGGLVRLGASGEYVPPYPLEFDCADSLWLGSGEAFVTQTGSAGVEGLRSAFVWKGGRNFFEGFPVQYARASARADSPLSLSFYEWQALWGALQERQLTRADWRHLPEISRPYHAHAPEDYALDDQSWDNPALGGASDGYDAGMLFGQPTAARPAGPRPAAEDRTATGPNEP